jgi:hypothetical protein
VVLSPDQIKALLAIPSKRGGRGKGGKTIDTSVRDYSTWFKLAHRILDKEDATIENCSNPDCPDPRTSRTILVAEIDGIEMCRICFLNGYGNT